MMFAIKDEAVRQRDFITIVGVVTFAWPLAARAQQPPMPVIGFLNSQSAEGYSEALHAFHQGLKAAGYIEGDLPQSTHPRLVILGLGLAS
jgi:hypothetical protein